MTTCATFSNFCSYTNQKTSHNNDLKYYWCKQTDLDGIPVVVSRTGWSGEIGYEVYLRDGKRGADLYEKIMTAGKQHKIAPTGPSQIRRVEAGIFSTSKT